MVYSSEGLSGPARYRTDSYLCLSFLGGEDPPESLPPGGRDVTVVNDFQV